MKKDELLHKWLNGNTTGVELDQLKRDPEYAFYMQIANECAHFGLPEMDPEKNFYAILKKMHGKYMDIKAGFSGCELAQISEVYKL